MDLDQLLQNARHANVANIFSAMSSEERSQQLLAQVHALSDAQLDLMAQYEGIPTDQIEMYRGMVRGNDRVFQDELAGVDGLLQPGDLILCTGETVGAKIITRGQKLGYGNARSSHVAMIHADFICVDAMPSLGVSNRLVSEVLSDVKPGWRVIRCKKLKPEHTDHIYRACAFFLAQPYKIRPSSKPMKAAAYCSELARKVFHQIGIAGIGIPNDSVLSPGKFDELADGHPAWEDVTEQVRPAIEFCLKYPKLLGVASRLMVEGLKLNRKRYEERKAFVTQLQVAASKNPALKERTKQVIKEIREIESNMNHEFWDHSKNRTN